MNKCRLKLSTKAKSLSYNLNSYKISTTLLLNSDENVKLSNRKQTTGKRYQGADTKRGIHIKDFKKKFLHLNIIPLILIFFFNLLN